MDGRVPLAVDRVHVGAPRHQVPHDRPVAGDDGEVERRVALLVLLVEQLRLRGEDLVDAVQVLVLGAVVERGLPRAVKVPDGPRLKRGKEMFPVKTV